MPFAVLATSGYTVLLDAMLAEMNVYIHLYTNDPTLTSALTPAAFVEPVYSGYQPLSVRKWVPSALRAGVAVSVGDPPLFEYVGGALPLPIRGYYATDGPGGVLLWAWRRPGDPFAFTSTNRYLLISPRATFPFVQP